MDKRRELLLKKVFGAVMSCPGVLRLCSLITGLGRGQGAKGVTILTYHRVLENVSGHDLDKNIISATSKNFDTQMKFLSDNYNVISFDHFIEYMQNKEELPENSVIITFDDGYRDNYTNAFPVLKKYGIAATILLATGYIDNRDIPWWDRIAYIINKTKHTRFRLDGLGEYFIEKVWQKEESIKCIQEKLKEMGNDKKDSMITGLGDILNVKIPENIGRDLFLSWDEIREMCEYGVLFGAHTVTHSILTRISPGAARDEITGSKNRIEAELGRAVRVFAYPNGGMDDFNEGIKEILKQEGIVCAVTGSYGTNDLKTGPYELKRINIDSIDTLSIFKSKVLGIFGALKGLCGI